MSTTNQPSVPKLNGVLRTVDQRVTEYGEEEIFHEIAESAFSGLSDFNVPDGLEMTADEREAFIGSFSNFYQQLNGAGDQIVELNKQFGVSVDQGNGGYQMTFNEPKNIQTYYDNVRGILCKTFALNPKKLNWIDSNILNKFREDIPHHNQDDIHAMPKGAQKQIENTDVRSSTFNLVFQVALTSPSMTALLVMAIPGFNFSVATFTALTALVGAPLTFVLFDKGINAAYLAADNVVQTRSDQGKNHKTLHLQAKRMLAMAISTLTSALGAVAMQVMSPSLQQSAIEDQLATFNRQGVEQILNQKSQAATDQLSSLSKRESGASDLLMANQEYRSWSEEVAKLEKSLASDEKLLAELEQQNIQLIKEGKIKEAENMRLTINQVKGRIYPVDKSNTYLQQNSYSYKINALRAKMRVLEDKDADTTKLRSQVKDERQLLIDQQQLLSKQKEILNTTPNPFDLLDKAGIETDPVKSESVVQSGLEQKSAKIDSMLNDKTLAAEILKLGVDDYKKLESIKKNWSEVSINQKIGYAINQNMNKDKVLFYGVLTFFGVLELLFWALAAANNMKPEVKLSKQKEYRDFVKSLLKAADKIVQQLAGVKAAIAKNNQPTAEQAFDSNFDESKVESPDSHLAIQALANTPFFMSFMSTLAADQVGPFQVLGSLNSRWTDKELEKNEKSENKAKENAEWNTKYVNRTLQVLGAQVGKPYDQIMKHLKDMAVPPIGGALGIGVFNTDITGGSHWKFQNAKDAPNLGEVTQFQSDLAGIYYRYKDLDKLKISPDGDMTKARSLNQAEQATLKEALNIEIQNLVSKHKDPGNYTEKPRGQAADELLALLDSGIGAEEFDYQNEISAGLNHILSEMTEKKGVGGIGKRTSDSIPYGNLIQTMKTGKALTFKGLNSMDEAKMKPHIKALKESLDYLLTLSGLDDGDWMLLRKCIIKINENFNSKSNSSIKDFQPLKDHLRKKELLKMIEQAKNKGSQAALSGLEQLMQQTSDELEVLYAQYDPQSPDPKIAELENKMKELEQKVGSL